MTTDASTFGTPKPQGPPRRALRLALVCLAALAGGYAMTLEPGRFFQAPASRIAPYHLRLPEGGKSDRAIAFYQQRLARNPHNYMDLATMGGIYLKRARESGDPSWFLLAEQSARRSLADMPTDNAGAQMVLAQVAIARHDFPEAQRMMKEAAKTHPESTLSSQVTVDLALGRVKEAAGIAEAIARLEPELGNLNQLALARVAQGRDADAEQTFMKGISREQTGDVEASALARTWLGRIKYKHGRLDDAEDLYREALRITPDNPVTLGLLGDLETRRGHFGPAADAYARAFAHNQGAAYLVAQARALELAGKPAEAAPLRAQAETLLRRDLVGGSFGHRRDLAKLLLDRNSGREAAEALALMTTETKLRRDPETMNQYARALSRNARQPEALAAIDQALANGYQDAELCYRQAAIRQALGDAPGAAQAIARARAIDPSFSHDLAYATLVREGLNDTPRNAP